MKEKWLHGMALVLTGTFCAGLALLCTLALEGWTRWACWFLTAGIFAGVWMAEWMNRRGNRALYSQVSRMLDGMLRDQLIPEISSREDSLLSKLQFQTEKLANIFRAREKEARTQRKETQELVSDICHQLKTPIANVRLYGDLLKDPDLNGEQRAQFVQALSDQLDKLTFLLESMIKMSRLEVGIIQLKPREASLNSTVMKAVGQAYQKAQARDIHLELERDEPVRLRHDPDWTAEAVFNLLDNGIKYTPPGGTIRLRIFSYELFARIDVEDNGPGIPKEEWNCLFRRFYRGGNGEGVEGIGLGLTLSREIILRQGGYIKISSPAKGSVFSVFLPLAGTNPAEKSEPDS